ncbi:hypothetical protein JCGZ_18094 [Jatropha curcas]|uniref:Uncharacterized protein n=1 Tax=Jatropha curcas TaxID=180498 RepID=A0A067K2G4_JATCU|nr:hypothetical protein JCGZ_18094 [Jatropha curcas]
MRINLYRGEFWWWRFCCRRDENVAAVELQENEKMATGINETVPCIQEGKIKKREIESRGKREGVRREMLP